MATTPREWPNQAMSVRDDSAELVKAIIENLQKISNNEANDEEAIETIAADSINDLYTLLRALEAVGAQTNPINELSSRVSRVRLHLIPVRA
jgi:molecular chaperone GrpE (heat shock protein)